MVRGSFRLWSAGPLCKQKQHWAFSEMLVQSFSVSKQGHPVENSARATITPSMTHSVVWSSYQNNREPLLSTLVQLEELTGY